MARHLSARPAWPEGYQSAVALAFDLDGPTGDAMLNKSLKDNMRYFTEGSYGPFRALPRLLDLLKKYQLSATFFIPTWVLEHWPERCERIIEDGHEVAYHGHRHEVFINCNSEQQLEIMEHSKAIFKQRLGVQPVGFRTPSGDWNSDTAKLLFEFGVQYSSSMRGDDRPYFHLNEGKVGLVEIPGRWDIDDYSALALFELPSFPSGGDRISPYQQVASNWCHEFEGYHQQGLCWTTILHPKVSAKPGRLKILDTLFKQIRSHDDVWVSHCSQIAKWWRSNYDN
ncbi:polysaccharide deacetylase family protein [Celerinatantimonas sp. MCCC 1A17872]|uniref:polysaccharide deacetylase family protein n=1 Tax=Celerinatantimonas sp. MCCC 1A17872 TaxID=3177514 RepID=UPI0038C7A6BB